MQTLHFPNHVILLHDIKGKTKPKQTKNVTLIKNLSHYKYIKLLLQSHIQKTNSNQIKPALSPNIISNPAFGTRIIFISY